MLKGPPLHRCPLGLGARGIPPRLATNADVTEGMTPEPGGKPIPLALSPSALRSGYVLLYLGPEQNYNDAFLSAYLKAAIYGGNSLFDIYKPPLVLGLASLIIQLPFSIAKDVRRRRQLRYGRRLKGPEMLTPKEFKNRVGGDGIGVKTDEMKAMIPIPVRAEAQHMQIIAKESITQGGPNQTAELGQGDLPNASVRTSAS